MAGKRRFLEPWRAEKMPGGYVVRDANDQALAYVNSRANPTDAMQAKVLVLLSQKATGESIRESFMEAIPIGT